MRPAARTPQRGVAVVLAMGVAALCAIAAAGMLASQSTWSRHAELAAEHAQAQALVRAGVDWARALLGDDQRLSNVDHLGEPWAMRVPPVQVDNGLLAGQIDDQQAAFNLNNLVRNGIASAPHLAQFQRLLRVLDLPESLADALADWIGAGVEPPLHLAAHHPLVDPGELALAPGFDASVRARLRPFITALPRFTAINVNTASPEVLAAVVRDLDLDAARELAVQRERVYFRHAAEFVALLPPGAAADAGDLSATSQFFVASVRVTYGSARASGSALLARGIAGWPAVAWRKYP